MSAFVYRRQRHFFRNSCIRTAIIVRVAKLHDLIITVQVYYTLAGLECVCVIPAPAVEPLVQKPRTYQPENNDETKISSTSGMHRCQKASCVCVCVCFEHFVCLCV